MADGLVLDESTIRTITGDTYYYYADEIPALTQADIPWQPGADGQPVVASGHHVVIAADTVTVRGTLRNPSRDIRIFARRITFENDVVLDVSGADPEHDYAPGDLPQQKDNTAGAKGASGGIGSPGRSAGNISIFAETLVGPADGSVTFVDAASSMTSQFAGNAEAARLAVTRTPGLDPKPLGDVRRVACGLTGQYEGQTGQGFVDFTSLALAGASSVTMQVDVAGMEQGSLVLTVAFPAMSLAGHASDPNTYGLGTGPVAAPDIFRAGHNSFLASRGRRLAGPGFPAGGVSPSTNW